MKNYYGGESVWQLLERLGIAKDFARGNVIKYVARAGHKGDESASDSYVKALWYLQQLIKMEEEIE